MACASCEERKALLVKAHEAYKRGDIPEARRLLNEVFGTTVQDVGKLIAMITRRDSAP